MRLTSKRFATREAACCALARPAARPSGAIDDDERLRPRRRVVHAVDQLGAGTVDARWDVHHPILAHRTAVEDDHVGAGIERRLDLVGGETGRFVMMLDELAERLARYVEAGEQLAAGLLPCRDPAGEDCEVAIAELAKTPRRTFRQPVIGVA